DAGSSAFAGTPPAVASASPPSPPASTTAVSPPGMAESTEAPEPAAVRAPACSTRSSEAGLSDVQLDGAPGLEGERRHVGRVAGGHDDDLVAAGLHVAELEAAGAVRDVAGEGAVQEDGRAAHVRLDHDDGAGAAHGGVDHRVAVLRDPEADRLALV